MMATEASSPSLSVGERPKWSLYKVLIAELYEQHELKDVMNLMRKNHNFNATENQYKQQLVRWGLKKKHTKTKEHTAVAKSKRRRQQERKESVFLPNYEIPRFDEHLGEKEKVGAEERLSDMSMPPDLECRTTTHPWTDPRGRPTFQLPDGVPALMSPVDQWASDTALFRNANSIHHATSTSYVPTQYPMPTPTLALDKDALEAQIRRFSRIPASPADQRSLMRIIERANVPCDEFCTQCPLFGHVPASNGCLLHRCLSRVLAQFRLQRIRLPYAQMLVQGIIGTLLPDSTSPEPSLIRVAADLAWILTEVEHDGTRTDTRIALPTDVLQLLAAAHITPALLCPQHRSYRSLLCSTALTLASMNYLFSSLRTLHSILGTDLTALEAVSATLLTRELPCASLSLEHAVSALTNESVCCVEEAGGQGWRCFDADVEAGIVFAALRQGPTAWWKDERGVLRTEEVLVRGFALRAVVEVEWRSNRCRAQELGIRGTGQSSQT